MERVVRPSPDVLSWRPWVTFLVGIHSTGFHYNPFICKNHCIFVIFALTPHPNSFQIHPTPPPSNPMMPSFPHILRHSHEAQKGTENCNRLLKSESPFPCDILLKQGHTSENCIMQNFHTFRDSVKVWIKIALIQFANSSGITKN